MFIINKESKNISIKDVGITMPKSINKCSIYSSKTGDEGSIYAATQGMGACNNNNMRNQDIKGARVGA